MEDEYTPEEIAQTIASMGESVTLIDNMLGATVGDYMHGYLWLTEDERLDSIRRGVSHLETMLAKQHVLDSGADLKPFHAAIKRGTHPYPETVE